MLRYIFADKLHHYPNLRDTMFLDRADQFRTRLGWEVAVSENGEERDQYDDLNPLYAIWETEEGTHGGSMRFLPTTNTTMLNDHFVHLLNDAPLKNAGIWESTRFCLARGASPQVSAALMLGAIEIGVGMDLDFLAGVFDARMVRIYRRLGWSPVVLGTQGEGRDAISAGLWHCSENVADHLARKADIPRALSRTWFHTAMQDLTRTRKPRLVVA